MYCVYYALSGMYVSWRPMRIAQQSIHTQRSEEEYVMLRNYSNILQLDTATLLNYINRTRWIGPSTAILLCGNFDRGDWGAFRHPCRARTVRLG